MSHRDHNLDRRHKATSTLMNDLPSLPGGAPAHKAGAAIILAQWVAGSNGKVTSYPAFSPCALAMDIAISAAVDATNLQSQLQFSTVQGPFGPVRSLMSESSTFYFDMLQAAFTCIVFSAFSVESFCNDVIYRNNNVLVPVQVKGNNQRTVTRQFPAKKLERKSTEDKIDIIVPFLLGKPSPKGSGAYGHYKRLLRLRNEVVHLQEGSVDTRVKSPSQVDKTSVIAKITDNMDFMRLPADALAIVEHFIKDDSAYDWLSGIRESLEVARAGLVASQQFNATPNFNE